MGLGPIQTLSLHTSQQTTFSQIPFIELRSWNSRNTARFRGGRGFVQAAQEANWRSRKPGEFAFSAELLERIPLRFGSATIHSVTN